MKVLDYQDSILTLQLSEEDLILFKNALAEVCFGAYAIEESEFATLFGDKKERAASVCKQLKHIMDDLSIVE